MAKKQRSYANNFHLLKSLYSNRVKRIVFCFSLCLTNYWLLAQTKIYLIPGQGSDYRVFEKLTFPDGYVTEVLEIPTPEKGETLEELAARFIPRIDTTQPFILIGQSLGGMICTELSTMLKPEKTILISSAKCRAELPAQYRFQRQIPLNKITPRGFYYFGAQVAQPIFEPDRKQEKETFKSMLKAKNSVYMKRSVDVIVNWSRTEIPPNIIHIHGDNDHTLPIKNIEYNYLISNGSHMMVLTRAEEVSKIISHILEQ